MGIPVEKPYRGHAQWFKLVSNSICYGPCPDAHDEIEQHLRISADGRVWLSRYAYDAGDQHVCTSKEQLNIGAEEAERIMKAVDDCFTGYSPQMVTDIGVWNLTIVNQEGEEFQLYGSLLNRPEYPETDLSDLIRNVLDLPDLFVFDGDAFMDRVERLCIDYHRITKIKPKIPVSETVDYVTWDYTEQLILDRATETLEHVQNIGSSCKVSRKYYAQGGVENLLDGIEEGFLDDIKGEPEDAITDPLDLN